MHCFTIFSGFYSKMVTWSRSLTQHECATIFKFFFCHSCSRLGLTSGATHAASMEANLIHHILFQSTLGKSRVVSLSSAHTHLVMGIGFLLDASFTLPDTDIETETDTTDEIGSKRSVNLRSRLSLCSGNTSTQFHASLLLLVFAPASVSASVNAITSGLLIRVKRWLPK